MRWSRVMYTSGRHTSRSSMVEPEAICELHWPSRLSTSSGVDTASTSAASSLISGSLQVVRFDRNRAFSGSSQHAFGRGASAICMIRGQITDEEGGCHYQRLPGEHNGESERSALTSESANGPPGSSGSTIRSVTGTRCGRASAPGSWRSMNGCLTPSSRPAASPGWREPRRTDPTARASDRPSLALRHRPDTASRRCCPSGPPPRIVACRLGVARPLRR